MKKLMAVITALCLCCAAFPGLADTEPPTWESMPGVVIEDENTTVDEAAFQGDWVLDVAFAGEELIDLDTLTGTYGIVFSWFEIGDGKLTRVVQQENGEFVSEDAEYVFEAGQLQCLGGEGYDTVVELLEDGNTVMSVFVPQEGDTVLCVSLFLRHPAEI